MKIAHAIIKKVNLVLLLCAVLCSSIPVGAQTQDDSDSKLSKLLQEKMDEIGNSDELTPVYIWYKDIQQQDVEEQVEEKIGFTVEELDASAAVLDEQAEKKIYNSDFAKLTSDAPAQQYLEETKELREELEEETDSYIEAKREVAKAEYTEASNAMLQKMELKEENIIFRSKYAPMLIVQMTKEEILQASRCIDVEKIDLYVEEEMEPESVVAPGVVITDLIQGVLDVYYSRQGYKTVREKTGLTGKGVKVGVLEEGRQDEIYDYSDTYDKHCRSVYGLVHTIAPNATIDLTLQDCVWKCMYPEIEKMIDNGVRVINLSWGLKTKKNNESDPTYYTSEEQWLDHVAYMHDVTVVKSAGNNNRTNDPGDITNPGKAYNVITVGACSDFSVVNSSGQEYGTACFKPDFVTYSALGQAGAGTSFSAAATTGTIALMLELKPTLALYPEAIKAILMASCFKKANNANVLAGTGGCDLRKWQGAGMLDPLKALSIVKKGQYRAGQFIGKSIDIPITQSGSGASKMNVSMSWLMKSEVYHDQDVSIPYIDQRQDLDLRLRPSGSITDLARSSLSISSTEMLSIPSSKFTSNSKYTINVQRFVTSNVAVRYAFAWAMDNITY